MHLKQTGELSCWVHTWIIFDCQCPSTHHKYFFIFYHKSPQNNVAQFRECLRFTDFWGQYLHFRQRSARLRSILWLQKQCHPPLQRHIQLTRRFKGIIRPKMICLVSRNVHKPLLDSKGKLLHGQMEYSRRKWRLKHLSSTWVKFRDVWSLFSLCGIYSQATFRNICNTLCEAFFFFGRYFASGHIIPYLFSSSPLGGLLGGLLPSLPSLLPSKWKVPETSLRKYQPHVSFSRENRSCLIAHPNDAFQNRN